MVSYCILGLDVYFVIQKKTIAFLTHNAIRLRPRSHGNDIAPFHIVPFQKVELSGVAFTRERLK